MNTAPKLAKLRKSETSPGQLLFFPESFIQILAYSIKKGKSKKKKNAFCASFFVSWN